jgi:hypothetical protein
MQKIIQNIRRKEEKLYNEFGCSKSIASYVVGWRRCHTSTNNISQILSKTK